MHASPLTTGRTFGVTFDHGENFLQALERFCDDHDLRQGYLPMFIGAFTEAELVGTCEKVDDAEAPVWGRTHLTNVEALGGGTLARDPDSGALLPHIHLTVGMKTMSAEGRTSHLLSARVQFLSELLVVEVIAPPMIRRRNPDLYDVPLLTFGHSAEGA